ncbi:cellulose biosynthesis protein BcsG [Budviciaceae bacterium BWR-B9]|uniref:Cellulose biosynthesis protein BcsG n=1 Tax=Limnobaculum allomyrinae TaxID=2791986 RepID=A0ABS1IQD1_9GAMM|nr:MULTISPECIES: cellulose biosynthesis protein BcsG [Limnobaculum]MBK5143970.1 cellulose biosynthesis protein BcsG [Limnobaculum allomyrinae]MBV7691629.1 cellulose biosynthesis protein BcsG [Limnobaculum sp. M2-1]
MNNEKISSPPPSSDNNLWKNWQGLKGWNYYFLIKFALLWGGYLNFHPLENLVFVAFLLFPLPAGWLRKIRNWVAVPVGIALFYYDTWLPGIQSIISLRSQATALSFDYMVEFVQRFINWSWVGAGFALLVGYLFISQWVRITPFVVAALVWLNVIAIGGPSFNLMPATATTNTPSTNTPTQSGTTDSSQSEALGPPTSQNLTAYYDKFIQTQQNLHTEFPASLPADAQPFDLLIINICSLSWSDMQAAGLADHPVWKKMNVVFDNFNSATSYSGPAAIRISRASCGQSSHAALYKATDQRCYLFNELAQLGFKNELVMDHSGAFGDYLKQLREYAGIQATPLPFGNAKTELTSFDGEPLYSDLSMLTEWLEARKKGDSPRAVTFYNTIELHDGNRGLATNKPVEYKKRLQDLFDDLDNFLDELDKSGRKVMVMIVPEHGAALVGDKMQVSGLRDIPSPSITHIPVGIRIVGAKAPAQSEALHITSPSSYLAISELVNRTLDGKLFTQDSIDWQKLTENLPQTPAISETSGTVVMKYQDKTYIRLNNADWVPYPQ